MTKDICNTFKNYLNDAANIYDIMAAAYKALLPFEPAMMNGDNESLRDAIYCFAEQEDDFFAFTDLVARLQSWSDTQENENPQNIKCHLFLLIRLISERCVKFIHLLCADCYTRYSSLNTLFTDEIIILPRYESVPMKIMSNNIAKKSGGYGFYGRNYASSADISGYINNFVIFRTTGNIRPMMNIPRDYTLLKKKLENQNYQLKIGLFPLSDINIKNIFHVKESTENKLFDIASPLKNHEQLLLERCKKALLICKDNDVDIAIFPEMLLTKYIQSEIARFVKNSTNPEKFPHFIWLGTEWSERTNKCSVIDRYGNIVFEQNKYVPYEYKTKIDNGTKITIRENLYHNDYWYVNFVDIPGVFRIATAICRDIASDYLTAFLKELYSDMVIIPAFSNSNRLTKRKIETLALDHIIVVVCNACSALKDEKNTTKLRLGEILPFCYICLPAKEPEDNAAVYHEVKINEKCQKCRQYCPGHIFTISFSECVQKGKLFSAKVTYNDDKDYLITKAQRLLSSLKQELFTGFKR